MENMHTDVREWGVKDKPTNIVDVCVIQHNILSKDDQTEDEWHETEIRLV